MLVDELARHKWTYGDVIVPHGDVLVELAQCAGGELGEANRRHLEREAKPRSRRERLLPNRLVRFVDMSEQDIERVGCSDPRQNAWRRQTGKARRIVIGEAPIQEHDGWPTDGCD